MGLLCIAAQKSKSQMLPFETPSYMAVEAWAPGFILCFTFIPTFSFLSSKGAAHNAEGGSIS